MSSMAKKGKATATVHADTRTCGRQLLHYQSWHVSHYDMRSVKGIGYAKSSVCIFFAIWFNVEPSITSSFLACQAKRMWFYSIACFEFLVDMKHSTATYTDAV
jgi:hypothetical protein